MPIAEYPLWAEMGFACSHQCMGMLQWEIRFLLRETLPGTTFNQPSPQWGICALFRFSIIKKLAQESRTLLIVL